MEGTGCYYSSIVTHDMEAPVDSTLPESPYRALGASLRPESRREQYVEQREAELAMGFKSPLTFMVRELETAGGPERTLADDFCAWLEGRAIPMLSTVMFDSHARADAIDRYIADRLSLETDDVSQFTDAEWLGDDRPDDSAYDAEDALIAWEQSL